MMVTNSSICTYNISKFTAGGRDKPPTPKFKLSLHIEYNFSGETIFISQTYYGIWGDSELGGFGAS